MFKAKSLQKILIVILLGVCLSTVFIGRYPITMDSMVNIISGHSGDSVDKALFLSIRLPRMAFAVVVGAFLALAGAIYQSLFRNPLVAPDVLGVSSGATIGAVMSIVLLNQPFLQAQSLTFFFGLGAVLLTLLLAHRLPKHTYSLVLAGIVVASLANSIIMMFKYIADPNRELVTIEYWLMGSLQNADWQRFLPMFIGGVIVCIILFRLRYALKVTTLGDDHAQTLGISVKRIRVSAIVLATILVSLTVMNTGVVAWIGLIAPHIVRLLLGEDIEKNFISILLVVACLLLIADTIARSLLLVEIPISVVTSFIGAILLGVLMIRRLYGH